MHSFRKYLTKEQMFTIPNFMSLFRVVLLPFIVWTYWKGVYDVTAGLVIVSALTDILDGVIARKFNMVSDLGKMLDPLCDKLTHAALALCVVRRYAGVWIIFGLLVVKELTMLVLGAIAVQRNRQVHSAKWYGKLCTVVFESVMLVLILLPDIPAQTAMAMLAVCGGVMIFSMVRYMLFFLHLILHTPRK